MFEELFKLIRQERVSLFLGAGFSRNAGAPSCWDITSVVKEAALRKVKNKSTIEKLNSINDLSQICEEFVQLCEGNRSELNGLLDELFSFKPKYSKEHDLLVRIPLFKRIFTTNYDSLLEDSYGDNANVIRNDNDVANIDNKKVNIFKIHGDLIEREKIIITDSDYQDFFEERKNKGLWGLVQTEFLTQNILFIGYSIEDKNIYKLIERVQHIAPQGTKRLFLIAPKFEDYKKKRLQRLGVTYYDAKADQFLARLYSEVCENITDDFEHGDISHNTYTKFLQDNELKAEASLGWEQSEVKDVKFIGQRRHTTIDFKVSESVYAKILNHDFSNIDLKEIPEVSKMPKNFVGLELKEDEIHSLKLKMNGVKVKDEHDFKRLIIIPRIKKVKSKILIVGKRFTEKVVFNSFQRKKNEFCFAFNNGFFELTLFFDCDEKSNIIASNIKIDFNEHIECTLRNALRWCEFLINLWEGDTLRIKNDFSIDLVFNKSNENELVQFRNTLNYIENMIYLEEKQGISFTRKDAYTPEKHEISKVLFHYYSQTVRESYVPEDSIFNYVIENKDTDLPKKGNRYTFSVAYQSGKITDFNGFSTIIPFCYEIYPDCEVIESKTEGSSMYLNIKPKETTRFTYYLNQKLDYINTED